MKDILLKKSKARTAVLFRTEPEDDWFVEVITFELKSGKQTSKSLIIQKDVGDWLDMYQGKGWTLVDERYDKEIVESKSKSNKQDHQDEEPF